MKKLFLTLLGVALAAASAFAYTESDFDYITSYSGASIGLRASDHTAVVIAQSNFSWGEDIDFELPSTIKYNGADYILIEVDQYAFRGSLYRSITLPPTIKAISSYALYASDNLSKIVFPNYLTELPDYVVYKCPKLEEVVLPSNLEKLGSIRNCTMLHTINLPASLKEIGEYGLYGNDLTSITLGENITELGKNVFSNNENLSSVNFQCKNLKAIPDYAFSGCKNIYRMTLPESVEELGAYAFRYCSNLWDFKIPSAITQIGAGCFYGCSEIEAVTIPSGLTKLEDMTFNGCTSITAIDIPASIKSIGKSCFANTGITRLTLHEGLTSIGESAFSNSAIGKVTLPASLTHIGGNPFGYCGNLLRIDLAEGNTSFRSIDGILYNADVTELIAFPTAKTELNAPASVVTLAASGMSGFKGETVNLGQIVNIGDYALASCPNLESIDLSRVKTLGDYSLSNCPNLKDITLPQAPETLDEYIFYYCEGLESISIPSTWRELPRHMCRNCTSLKNVKFNGEVELIGAYCFQWCEALEEFTFPKGLRQIDQSAFYQAGLKGAVDVPEGVVSMGKNGLATNPREFFKCGNVTSITLPSTLGNSLNINPYWTEVPKDYYLVNFSNSPIIQGFGQVPSHDPKERYEYIYYCWPNIGYYTEDAYAAGVVGEEMVSTTEGCIFIIDVQDAMWSNGIASFTMEVPNLFEIGRIYTDNGLEIKHTITPGEKSTLYHCAVSGVNAFPDVKVEVRYHSYNLTATVGMNADGIVEAGVGREALADSSDATIRVRNHAIEVRGLAYGEIIAVYDTMGRNVATATATGNTTTVGHNLTAGAYIVKAGRTTQKVFVR